jgi:streptogramin lyase
MILTLAAISPAAPKSSEASKQPKSVKSAANTTARPAAGIKAPGIQIPFSSLKADVDLPSPARPSWLFFSESLFTPNSLNGSVEKLEAKTGKAGDPITGISKPCTRIASGFGSLWVPSCGDGSLVRLDAKTLKKSAQIETGIAAVPGALAVSSDSVWLLTDNKTTLSRIDPDKNAVIADLRLPAGCKNLTFGETALWLVCPAQNQVLHINPATNLVTKRITVSADPQSLAIGEGSVWVLCSKEGRVERIDPKTDKVIKTIELGVPAAVGEIAFGEGSIWVTMTGFPLTRINPTKDEVVQQFYGTGGGAIQISTGAVWLSNEAQAKLWKIDPKRVAATLAE